MVLPWTGIDGNTDPIFPIPSRQGGGPKADASGKSSVPLMSWEAKKLLIQVKPTSGGYTLAEFENECIFTTSVYPSNVRASVNGKPPFWSFPGVLKGETELLGLDEALNVLSDEISEPIVPQLTLDSDSAGVMTIVDNLNDSLPMNLSAEASFGGARGGDVALVPLADVNIDFHFPVPAMDMGKKWHISRLELETEVELPPWRVYGLQSIDIPGKMSASVNARFGTSRSMILESDCEMYGISLPLSSIDSDCEMLMEVVPDANGEPGQDKQILASTISTATPTNSVQWVDFLFDEPVHITSGTWWMVLKAKTGHVHWSGDLFADSEEGVSLFNDEGTQWQPYPALKKPDDTIWYPIHQARIMRKAQDAEISKPLLLEWKVNSKSARAEVTGEASSERIVLELPDSATWSKLITSGQVTLSICYKANVSGVLHIKSCRAYYTLEEK